jgi:hypothetical protein
MLKRLFTLFIVLAANNVAVAQIDTVTIKQNIINQSDSMFIAFKNQDWDVFSDYMHPDIVKLAKGKASFVSMLQQEMKQLSMIKFDEIRQVGNIQLVSTKKSIQCVVQYGLGMQIDSTAISSVSASIGESMDNGKTWKFVRNNYQNFNVLKAILPWVDERLKIPAEAQKYGMGLSEFLLTYKPTFIKSFAVRNTYSRKKQK